MTQINWGIAGMARDPGQAFTEGMQRGQAMRLESDKRNALSAYAQNPQDANALNALMGIDPVMGMQLQQRQQQSQQQGLEAHRDNILAGARIVREINPQDDAGWQQVRAIAGQMQIPLDEVPETFDPNYVRGLIATADALDPQAEAKPDLVVIDGVAIDKRTGQPVFESPYDRIIPGPGGSFYRVPRLGIGRGGGQAQPQGTVVQGELPEGWTLEEEGGSESAPSNFPGQ